MAEIKNFGLTGVGTDVQLGKAGPRLKVNSGIIEMRNPAGDSLTVLRAANAVTDQDVVTLAQLNTVVSNAVSSNDGFKIQLGDVATEGDGSWTPGAVPFTDTMPVSEGMDRLNEILGLLVPASPPSFPNATTLTVSNSSGNTPLLASGVTDNSGSSTITAGSAVTRLANTNVSSNTFNDVGDGSSGTVQLLINGSVVGSKALTGTGDGGTYSGLVIADQKDYPTSTPGFWKSLDISVATATVATGVNKFKLNHTAAGATSDIYFVRDSVTAVPVVNGTVTQSALGTVAYSSSVPHYNTSGVLTINGTLTNLAGQTYYGGADPLVISGTNSIFANKTFTHGNLGISLPIAQNTTSATAISAVTVAIDGTNIHNSGIVQAVAKNVNGSSTTTTLTGPTVLVKRGTTTRIDEMLIPVTGLGSSPNANSALRVSTVTGDRPSTAVGTWDQTASLNTWDAAVVAGLLSNNTTNYSTGYLPVGPNLSGQDAAQYVVFSFNRTALSQFKINVTGTYAGVWIKLPGVSDSQPNAVGGWWNAFKPYDGAGIPGETGDTDAGCASGTVMTGSTGTFQITFGTGSSTNATSNQILVRIRLNTGQSISALSFTN